MSVARLACFWLLLVIVSTCDGTVDVHTKLGWIRGTSMLSRDGKKFNAFLGVPFAEAPLGELRFENPVPVKPWNHVLNATSYPSICPQISPRGIIGNEDCLYMNIYTPQVKNISNLPIWVYIYGGRRILGHGLPYKYGPEYILDKQVIFVVVAYRIGPVGYLSTEDMAIPGNYGLKDQVMALRWIQEHISAFGGDPTNVTLSGGSSGAADASLHLFSPLSKGLFHRCISQSGQLLNFWTLQKPGKAREHAWKFARAVGCNSSRTSEQLLTCLKKSPIDILIRGTFSLMYDYLLPDVMFGAVIEHKYVDGAFLIENPAITIRKSNNVPWILGVTSDEGALGSVVLFANSKAVFHFEKHYRKIFPEFFGYEYSPNVDRITDLVVSRYLNNRPINESFSTFGQIFGSSHAYFGAMETALQYKGPKYFYFYDYKNSPDYLRNYAAITHGQRTGGMYVKHNTGPIHGEELISIFNYPSMFPPTIRGDDRVVSNQVLSLWYNFVVTGNPNGNGEEIWEPISTDDFEYLHINNLQLTMKTKLLWDDYEFWKKLDAPIIIKPETHMPLWGNS